MLNLIYYPSRQRGNKRELYVESDIKLNYRAVIPESGTQLDLYEGTQLIGQVNGTYIELFGKPIIKKS